MATRGTLRSQMIFAWRETIENYYNKRLINSEGGLQAFFCAALREKFDEENFKGNTRTIFVEPCLHLGTETRHPDIVICNSKNIICVIELKYTPRGKPGKSGLAKDMETLNGVVENADNLKISNVRYRGIDVGSREYQLAMDDYVICWAGVHTDDQLDLQQEFEGDSGKSFLALHAITRKGHEAEVWANGRKRSVTSDS